MTHRIRSLTCVALLAAQFLSGCTSWQVVDVSPRALVDSAHVKKLQVWETGGRMFVINAPAVSGDSLMWVGKVTLKTPANSATGEVAYQVAGMRGIPLADVDRVAVRKVSGLKTALLVGPPLLLVGGLVALYIADANGAFTVGVGMGEYPCCTYGW